MSAHGDHLADYDPIAARRRRRAAHAAEVNAAVATAVLAGERPCQCSVRGTTWRALELVLRCAVCGGLERGQLFACEDAGLIHGDLA